MLIACTHYITITAKDSTCSHLCPMLSFNIVTKEAENISNIPTEKETTDEKNIIKNDHYLSVCVHAGCETGMPIKAEAASGCGNWNGEFTASEEISKWKILEPF